ncbi:hypothetical protein HK098_005789 [Nowakowskiella sp. JEL0407]|nr:hypothetical protein HK098_005789 [Nowakowskiella sp. JEL0407]
MDIAASYTIPHFPSTNSAFYSQNFDNLTTPYLAVNQFHEMEVENEGTGMVDGMMADSDDMKYDSNDTNFFEGNFDHPHNSAVLIDVDIEDSNEIQTVEMVGTAGNVDAEKVLLSNQFEHAPSLDSTEYEPYNSNEIANQIQSEYAGNVSEEELVVDGHGLVDSASHDDHPVADHSDLVIDLTTNENAKSTPLVTDNYDLDGRSFNDQNRSTPSSAPTVPPTPPFLLEFNSNFYCFFSAPSSYSDSDDAEICLRDQGQIKSLFNVKNDVILAFPELKLSFFESGVTTHSLTVEDIYTLHTSFMSQSESSQSTYPVKMHLTDTNSNFQSQLEYLNSMVTSESAKQRIDHHANVQFDFRSQDDEYYEEYYHDAGDYEDHVEDDNVVEYVEDTNNDEHIDNPAATDDQEVILIESEEPSHGSETHGYEEEAEYYVVDSTLETSQEPEVAEQHGEEVIYVAEDETYEEDHLEYVEDANAINSSKDYLNDDDVVYDYIPDPSTTPIVDYHFDYQEAGEEQVNVSELEENQYSENFNGVVYEVEENVVDPALEFNESNEDGKLNGEQSGLDMSLVLLENESLLKSLQADAEESNGLEEIQEIEDVEEVYEVDGDESFTLKRKVMEDESELLEPSEDVEDGKRLKI